LKKNDKTVKALIFAAGMGTRLKEFTNDRPKALVELAGKTLLQHAIEKLIGFGVNDITINVHHFADQVISFIDNHRFANAEIHISDERDQLLDTGGGLKKAAQFLDGNEPILIHNVDVVSNLDLRALESFHLKSKSLGTLVVRQRKTSRYLMFDKNHQLAGWKNIVTGESIVSRENTFAEATPYAFSGIHIIQPELIKLISEEGKFSIIDLYLRLAKTEKITGYIDHSSIWMDLGKPEQLQKAENLFRNNLYK
jgi:NDP-sugar pyrophosphorylase family protein